MTKSRVVKAVLCPLRAVDEVFRPFVGGLISVDRLKAPL